MSYGVPRIKSEITTYDTPHTLLATSEARAAQEVAEHNWRVPINEVTEEERTERHLKNNAMERIVEQAYLHPHFPSLQADNLLTAYRTQGSVVARDRLAVHNLGLVINRSKQRYGTVRALGWTASIGQDDLVQEGSLGLLRSFDKKDMQRTTKEKFSTYAVSYIDGYMKDYVSEHGTTIAVPGHIQGIITTYRASINEAEQQLGRGLTHIEQAQLLRNAVIARRGYDSSSAKFEDNVTETIKATRMAMVQQYPVDIDNLSYRDKMSDTLVDPAQEAELDAVLDRMVNEKLEKAMKDDLSTRENAVLRMMYGYDGEDQTLDQVGHRFNVTRERVRQLEVHALRKLRQSEIAHQIRVTDNVGYRKSGSQLQGVQFGEETVHAIRYREPHRPDKALPTRITFDSDQPISTISKEDAAKARMEYIAGQFEALEAFELSGDTGDIDHNIFVALVKELHSRASTSASDREKELLLGEAEYAKVLADNEYIVKVKPRKLAVSKRIVEEAFEACKADYVAIRKATSGS